MPTAIRSLVSILALLAAGTGYAAELRTTRTFEESFAPAGGPIESLVVDNVFGSIRVRAHDGDTVAMTVTETVVARTERAAERARAEVRLETRHADGVVDLFVDGPFRDRRERGRRLRHDDPGYRVIYDLELRVPRRLDLDLSTVDEGEVDVAGVEGDFALRNVNGGLRLADAAGAGVLRTVNGDIRASFARAPRQDLEVHTVNGDIDLAFPPGLAADLEFESLNGELRVAAPERGGWELVALPSRTVRDERGGARYRVERVSSWRIGAGGPTLRLETLNGDVTLTGAD
ncbi:MAG TPA: hypothetical protein VMV46_13260 [Thermoanaerobaculia bacterium]|nr:hypothetical protein [Thermoanaerobaculia bacterium]